MTSNGQRPYWWRAVDQDDPGLDILGQSRPNKQAAQQCFRQLLKGWRYGPRGIITDKRKSYGAAKGEIVPGGAHRQSRPEMHNCFESWAEIAGTPRAA